MAFLRNLMASMLAVALFGIVSADYYEQFPKPIYQFQQKSQRDFASIKVQGLIYCRKDGQLIPLVGAMARITCMGGEFSVVSGGSDMNGYFRINLSKYGYLKDTNTLIRECKVYLETHPPGVCNVPTDVNHGLTGASLTPHRYRTLHDSSRIYSLPPLVYAAAY